MKNIIRRKHFYYILLLDICLILAAYLLSYILRFEGDIPYEFWTSFKTTIPYIIPFKILLFIIFGLYKGMWRYTGLFDLLNVLKATTISSSVIVLAVLFIYRFEGFSRSIYIMDWVLTFIFIGGVRIVIRMFLSENNNGEGYNLAFRTLLPFTQKNGKGSKKRLLIIGAGDTGEKMLREIMDNPRLSYAVVGFLDDNPKKSGMKIHGIKVLGPITKINEVCSSNEIDEILLALPSASSQQMRRIIEACESTGIKFRTTPGIGELINGKISFKAVREVAFEDLLGRETVNLDTQSIGGYLTGRVVFVTGAGGSIGSELCRQIAQFNPQCLILFDKTENSLFHIENEFQQRFPHVEIKSILGDLRFRDSLNRIFETHKPQVVFHAAAYKHVHIVELHPAEAVFNNVLGTKNTVEVSNAFGVERFIMVSTDKAVRPVNVMGATKRVGEMITSCYASTKHSNFVSVRFGNVIGSEGSVVHLFKKQIERFGPVTVTHPEMRRYFMTISEASKLILQAGAMGEGGEIFILDMGTPIKIVDMARDLIRQSGFMNDEDIEIKFIGLRPGEKLHEELITEEEGIVRTPHKKLLVLRGNGCDRLWLNGKIEELVHLASEQDVSGIKLKLKEIVPDYQPYNVKKEVITQPH